jgi:hypothetical protein
MPYVGGTASRRTLPADLTCPFPRWCFECWGALSSPSLAGARYRCPRQVCPCVTPAACIAPLRDGVISLADKPFGLRCMPFGGGDAGHQIESLRPVFSLEPPGGMRKRWLPYVWKPLGDAPVLEGGRHVHASRASGRVGGAILDDRSFRALPVETAGRLLPRLSGCGEAGRPVGVWRGSATHADCPRWACSKEILGFCDGM